MKAYYITDEKDNESFFIPWVLAGIETVNGIRYCYDPNDLEEMIIKISNKDFPEILQGEVIEIEVPEFYIRKFCFVCSETEDKRKIKKCARKIYGLIKLLVHEKIENYRESDEI